MDKGKKKTFFSTLAKMIIPIIVTCGFVLCINRVMHPISVNGSSMEPTYKSGNLLKSSTDFKESDIKRGDVVVFICDQLNEKYLIKRVVGIPGDSVLIKDGILYVNGKADESLQFETIEDGGIIEGKELTLANDEFFCMGDNRNNSNDSRFLGPVTFEDITRVITGKLL